MNDVAEHSAPDCITQRSFSLSSIQATTRRKSKDNSSKQDVTGGAEGVKHTERREESAEAGIACSMTTHSLSLSHTCYPNRDWYHTLTAIGTIP